MSGWPWWAWALLGLPWPLVAIRALALGRPRPRLRDWPALPTERSPLVSVIVPARNEARNIERCLRSILDSSYPSFEVIAVDDRSTDDTAAIVERLAGGDPRLRLLHGEELPRGWYGKPWACWQGYRAARGSLLLFTDADTVHGQKLLGHAVAMLDAERADLVSVMPRQEMGSFWERAVQPQFFLALRIRFGDMRRIARNTNPRHAIANGQFLLLTRPSYEGVGGHQAVRETVAEDLGLAIRYTAAGRRLRLALADEDMVTRMYCSLGEILEGWTKNMFTGFRMTSRSAAEMWLWYVAALVGPLTWNAVPLGALALGLGAGPAALALVGAIGTASCAALLAYVLHLNRANPVYALLYPLGLAVYVWILLRTAVRGTRRIEWRGRTYSHP